MPLSCFQIASVFRIRVGWGVGITKGVPYTCMFVCLNILFPKMGSAMLHLACERDDRCLQSILIFFFNISFTIKKCHLKIKGFGGQAGQL